MAAMSFLVWNAIAQENVKSKNYRKLIKQHIYADYKQMYKKPESDAAPRC